jgi:Sec-independent protein translocase protein TatA
MTDKLSDARRSLARAVDAARERLQQIEAERREIKASLKSLDAAMKAIDGQKAKSTRSVTPPPADTP